MPRAWGVIVKDTQQVLPDFPHHGYSKSPFSWLYSIGGKWWLKIRGLDNLGCRFFYPGGCTRNKKAIHHQNKAEETWPRRGLLWEAPQPWHALHGLRLLPFRCWHVLPRGTQVWPQLSSRRVAFLGSAGHEEYAKSWEEFLPDTEWDETPLERQRLTGVTLGACHCCDFPRDCLALRHR